MGRELVISLWQLLLSSESKSSFLSRAGVRREGGYETYFILPPACFSERGPVMLMQSSATRVLLSQTLSSKNPSWLREGKRLDVDGIPTSCCHLLRPLNINIFPATGTWAFSPPSTPFPNSLSFVAPRTLSRNQLTNSLSLEGVEGAKASHPTSNSTPPLTRHARTYSHDSLPEAIMRGRGESGRS